MKRHHHRIILYVIIAAAISVFSVRYIYNHYNPAASDEQIDTNLPIQPVAKSPTGKKSTSTPQTLNLKVPFTPQAPTGNWDQVHNEDCEEASAIMAGAYFGAIDGGAHQTDITLPPSFVEDQLNNLNQWEQDHLGYFLDIDSEEEAQSIQSNYGLNVKIVTDYSEDYIKNELAQNHLVLLPANGTKLGNPNFRSPGPPYHMLVLRGYAGNTIITNDPGTHRGMNYPYSFSTLYNANGDYDHATHSVDLSHKNIIVVWK